MRTVLVMISVLLLLVESGGMARPAAKTETAPSAKVPATSGPKAKVDFDTQIQPIFKSKCMPCHFNGGKVYDRLPFDKPETIKKLGTKLFTRIKDEDSRRLIDEFLAQSP